MVAQGSVAGPQCSDKALIGCGGALYVCQWCANDDGSRDGGDHGGVQPRASGAAVGKHGARSSVWRRFMPGSAARRLQGGSAAFARAPGCAAARTVLGRYSRCRDDDQLPACTGTLYRKDGLTPQPTPGMQCGTCRPEVTKTLPRSVIPILWVLFAAATLEGSGASGTKPCPHTVHGTALQRTGALHAHDGPPVRTASCTAGGEGLRMEVGAAFPAVTVVGGVGQQLRQRTLSRRALLIGV